MKKVNKALENASEDKIKEVLDFLGYKDKWTPNEDDEYYFIQAGGDIWTATLGKTRQSNQRLLMGNYYRTREEAEQALDFQTRKAKLIKEIEDSSDVINWEDTNHVKYHIWIDRRDNLLRVDGFVYLQDQGATYTTNIVFLEELIKERSDEVKELLFGIKS